MSRTIEKKAVDALRVLSADMIQKAKSGHPGMPLGAAPIAYELWANHMNHNPAVPEWPNRDRFILSAGHSSALLYALLHLYGYGDLSLEDLKQFRQLGSLTPGHPEYGHTVGVEATTGVLSAGLGMAVGLAAAEAHLAAIFNREGFPVVDHYTFALCGDGCLMEGLSSEAMSLAGTWKLGKLIVLYDSNRISIEGDTDMAFTENVQGRFEAFGFQTLTVEDGTDLAAIGAAIAEAKTDTTRPSLITIKTQIGYGCPAKQGKASSHGEPLGEANILEMKELMKWESMEPFFVPQDVYEHYRALAESKAAAWQAWQEMFSSYRAAYPELAAMWDRYHDGNAVKEVCESEDFWIFSGKAQATRNYSGEVINRIKNQIPMLMGGSADLGPSNKTVMKEIPDFGAADYAGRNIHFGVREMAMAAIGNGLALHGGIKPYVATFFVFSDFLKPMARMSALMELPLIYVFSHDSIGVGEDGPTHEPIEQLATLRAIPNFHAFRPADEVETAAAWQAALTSETTPTAILLTRQTVPLIEGTSKDALRGGYILQEAAGGVPDAILIASGSELGLAVEAKAILEERGIAVRVVSMPCMDIFEEQDAAYRESVLPDYMRKRVVVEALSDFGWAKYVGIDGGYVTMHGWGASAPFARLFPHFGFTAENVVAAVEKIL